MGRKLYVGNLPYGMSSSDLQHLFEAHGTVQSAQVIVDREPGLRPVVIEADLPVVSVYRGSEGAPFDFGARSAVLANRTTSTTLKSPLFGRSLTKTE